MESEVVKIWVDRGYVLAAYLQEDRTSLTEVQWQDNTFQVGGREYLILTDEEAEEAARKSVLDSLWAFRASFLEEYTEIDADVLESIQEKMYEDANPVIRKLIGSRLDEFVEDAIQYDGRGHFLSSYDNEENEVRSDDDDIQKAIVVMLREEEGLEENAPDPEWEYDFTTEEEDKTGIWLYIYRLS